MSPSAVTTQVDHVKSRPNLLVWYTADEPAGTSDSLDTTFKPSNLVTSLDDGKGGAGYLPIFIVLNCENFYLTHVLCLSLPLNSAFSVLYLPLSFPLSVYTRGNYTSGGRSNARHLLLCDWEQCHILNGGHVYCDYGNCGSVDNFTLFDFSH